jgi:hypothetical protein
VLGQQSIDAQVLRRVVVKPQAQENVRVEADYRRGGFGFGEAPRWRSCR